MDEWRNEPVLTVRSSYKERGTGGEGGGLRGSSLSRALYVQRDGTIESRAWENLLPVTRTIKITILSSARARTHARTHACTHTRSTGPISLGIISLPFCDYRSPNPTRGVRLPLMLDSHERQQSSIRSFQVEDLSLSSSLWGRARLPPVSSRSDT